LSKSEDGWWTGEKDGIIGHFPSMLVEELTNDRNVDTFAGIYNFNAIVRKIAIIFIITVVF
jgi:hypothetical protein